MFPFSYISHISCHFVFVEITPVHVPQSQPECFNVPTGIAWLVQQSFFQGVLARIIRNSDNPPFIFLFASSTYCILWIWIFRFLLLFHPSFDGLLKLPRFELGDGFIIFFNLFPFFFQCFPWVSLLTWFSPNAKVPFLVVVIFMIPVIIFTQLPTPKLFPPSSTPFLCSFQVSTPPLNWANHR